MVRNHCSFLSPITYDDSVEKDNDVIVPPGLKLITSISSRLNKIVQPFQRDHYGWEFSWSPVSHRKAWALLQWITETQDSKHIEWLLIVSIERKLFNILGTRRQDYEAAIFQMNKALAALNELQEIEWKSNHEYTRR
jgi:hypothetical protein